MRYSPSPRRSTKMAFRPFDLPSFAGLLKNTLPACAIKQFARPPQSFSRPRPITAARKAGPPTISGRPDEHPGSLTPDVWRQPAMENPGKKRKEAGPKKVSPTQARPVAK